MIGDVKTIGELQPCRKEDRSKQIQRIIGPS